jgi:Ca2+-binding EF-hand superfamily protein
MISYDTKLKLKDVFTCLGQEEIGIEKLRQVLASLKEFEPYASFKRIDREGSGYITPSKLSKFLKENGYREIEKEDTLYMIRYFD